MIDLKCGDCLELLKNIPDGSVDMVLCDLPYGMTRNEWDTVIPFEPLWKEYRRVCKQTAAIVLHCMQPFTSLLIASNLRDFRYAWVWDKHACRNFLNAHKQPLRNHEDIAVFYRKQCTYNPQMTTGKYRNKGQGGGMTTNYNSYNRQVIYNDQYHPKTIISIAAVQQGKNTHPTEKPVALEEYLIKTYTSPYDTVMDNCMGTGATGVASVRNDRHFIGIEMDKGYFETAKQRIENELYMR